MLRKKDKTQQLPHSHPFFHAHPHFLIPNSSSSSLPAVQVMGIGGCGQPMTAPLFLSYLRALFPFSIAAPSHGLQSFRINLLRCGLSMGCSSLRACPPSPAWSPPGAAGESLPGCLENLLCSSFSDFSVCRAVSHTFFPCSSLPGSILHFLTQAFPRVPPS